MTAGAANAVATAQVPTAKSTLGTVNVAGCPTLTLSPAEAAATFNVTIDFDGGCPLPNQTAPACSGSATGQINPTAQHLNLTLQGLTCGGTPALSGTVDLNFTRADPLITFNGTWDLSFASAGHTTQITGPGTVTLDTSSQVVTVTQFQGQLIRDTTTSNITIDSLQIPLTNNPSGLPSAGTIHLSGGLLRQLTIRFNENTPSTSIVDVSVFGLFFFPVDLNSLNL